MYDGDLQVRFAPMSTTEPARYRCDACGNLTRFDVVESRRTRSFHHFSVGGDLTVEDTEVLESTIEDVQCRWCGNGSAVVRLEQAPAEPS